MTDTFWLYLTRSVRAFGAGALALVLATDLARSGEPDWLVGIMVGLALGGASLWTLLAPRFERALGRRATLYLSALLLTSGGALLALDLTSSGLVALAALLGGLAVSTSDIGPLSTLEQATMGEVSTPATRTWNFSVYNLAGYVAGGLGALAAAPLVAFAPEPAWLPYAPRDGVLLLYALTGLALLPLYGRLSEAAVRCEPPPSPGLERPPELPTGPIFSLALLFSVDAFGGGLIASTLVAWWLEVHYGATIFEVGIVMFLATLTSGASLLFAVPLSRRLGLVRTMVFTHLPSNLLLLLFPFAPGIALAGAIWVGRGLLSQVDVPARQSLVQSVVASRDRTAAASYTTAARSTSVLGAPVTGLMWAAGGPWLAGPFLLCGTVKSAYDLELYRRFHKGEVGKI